MEQEVLERIWDVFIEENPNHEPMLSGNGEDKIRAILETYAVAKIQYFKFNPPKEQ